MDFKARLAKAKASIAGKGKPGVAFNVSNTKVKAKKTQSGDLSSSSAVRKTEKSSKAPTGPAFRANGKPLVDFFIVGAQKAGTMAAVKNLNKHPDVYVLKECHFFDLYWDMGIDWYKKQLKPDGKPIVGEKTPELIYVDECAHRMKLVCPDAKFVLCLRDPVKRAYSNWNMQTPGGSGVEDLSFSEAIEREVSGGLMGEKRVYGTALYHYVQRGFYMDQIERFLKVFPDRSKLHIVIAEHMRTRPKETYADLFSFVGADAFDLEAEDEHIGKYKDVTMPERTRQKLIKMFAPHNERLFKFLGYRIEEWQMPVSEGESNDATV